MWGPGGAFYIVLMEVEGPILNVGSTSPQAGAPAWVRRQAKQQHRSLLPDRVQCDQLPCSPAAGTPPAWWSVPSNHETQKALPKVAFVEYLVTAMGRGTHSLFWLPSSSLHSQRVFNGGKLVLPHYVTLSVTWTSFTPREVQRLSGLWEIVLGKSQAQLWWSFRGHWCL